MIKMIEINKKELEIYNKVKVQIEKNTLKQYLYANCEIGSILKACGVSSNVIEHSDREKIIEAEEKILSDEKYFDQFYDAAEFYFPAIQFEIENYSEIMDTFKEVYENFSKEHKDIFTAFMPESNSIVREGIVYELTDEEMDRIYRYKKREKEIEEVERYLNLSYNYEEFMSLIPNSTEVTFLKAIHDQKFLHAIYDASRERMRNGYNYEDAMNWGIERHVWDFYRNWA